MSKFKSPNQKNITNSDNAAALDSRKAASTTATLEAIQKEALASKTFQSDKSAEALLYVENLSKQYGSFTALDDISFVVPKGEIVGLLGPNGSGKTTLIKIINDLLHNYKGKILINGFEPGIESKTLVSYLPDRNSLPDWLKVITVVKMFADFFSDFDTNKAVDLLNYMNVPLDRVVKNLSKGMGEKLQLALVMSRNASLYVLDEPIAGVDPASRDLILKIILDNFSPNSSILISTHIISDVENLFDSVIFLKDGEIYLYEQVEKLRENHNKSVDQLFREVFAC